MQGMWRAWYTDRYTRDTLLPCTLPPAAETPSTGAHTHRKSEDGRSAGCEPVILTCPVAEGLRRNCPFKILVLLCIWSCSWWFPHIEQDSVQFLMTFVELSSALGIIDPVFQFTIVIRTFLFTCSNCFSRSCLPFFHTAHFRGSFECIPSPLALTLRPVTSILFSVHQLILTSLHHLHSPCFSPWESLRTQLWSVSVIHGKWEGSITHPQWFVEEVWKQGFFWNSRERKGSFLCTGELALPGAVKGQVVESSAQA